MLRAAPPGHGQRAGRTVAAICDVIGIRDVVSKVFGRRTPYSVVAATFDALSRHYSASDVAFARGQRIATLEHAMDLSRMPKWGAHRRPR